MEQSSVIIHSFYLLSKKIMSICKYELNLGKEMPTNDDVTAS